MLPPPRNTNNESIIHSIKQVYTVIYVTGKKLSKPDKLGIHARIENTTLEIMHLLIQAYFSGKNAKLELLEKARILLEILKHLVRTEHELKIIEEKSYIRIEFLIVETSKMTNGWITYILKQKTLN